ncbi:PREDICTED: uncharacterized protein C9orf43 homolog [Gekko japonicus]|uniref:Uncharacterized protein C9orf43 homolog n=1 Tax=Gekko japonicus TaxID=146911 RepID=A0ABM1KY25_GEKJA|nr:PREDICTED: uncharacterized protein C9orf43 homolog [Gekko japonicus]
MVTTDISQWDETICNMIACQHPPCWEAMRRIEKGNPRILIKNFNSHDRSFPETEDELPTLKIFNLPLNYSYSGRIKHAKTSSSIISIKDSNYSSSPTMIEAFVPPISVLSSERDHFPGLNSRAECHTPRYTPISFTSLRQVEKIQVTDLSELAAPKLGYQPAYGNLIVRWIPDIRHKLLQTQRPSTRIRTPTQRMCVKDLALENLLSFKNSSEAHCPNLQTRKKSNKVPTGGQPYLLHLRRNLKIPPNKSSSPTDKERKAVERPTGKRKLFPQHLQLSPLADTQGKSAIHLENKKRVFPGSKEFPLIVQKVPVKERGLRRIQSQLQIPLEGPGIPKHLLSALAQQLNSSTLTFQASGACGQRSEGESLQCQTSVPQEASAEKVHLPECSPQTSQVAINRRKASLKFVEYKSNRASLFMGGYDSSVHQMSKSESKYKQYCKQIAIRKGAALPQGDLSTDSKELWLREEAQKSEENLFQSPNPPPPSPLVSECGDSASQDLT